MNAYVIWKIQKQHENPNFVAEDEYMYPEFLENLSIQLMAEQKKFRLHNKKKNDYILAEYEKIAEMLKNLSHKV
jgi:hypothetical protein